ncbi:molybdopterin molybdotransferase MoeA [Ideonella sp. BN130291]|uniref:molybdopterin molybdotransferase MoeA n=1 Tax=Ideonella sp. BN130291 TaxID=3112940 RepID=UPI002E264390|nr:gephyrin-like molybdotransferase Glp [Ideonella sp. BN130291]
MTTPAPDRPAMLSLDEALSRLAAGARAAALSGSETVPTLEALGRVLAEEVRSLVNVPPGDNSAMDGYAVRVADVPAAGTVLPVSQRIPAGSVGAPLQPGTAARIFTGAQVPAGADAVVMQEQCEAVEGGVRIKVVPEPGQSIRRRGEDVSRGAVVLTRGTRLTPQGLGLAASVGAGRLSVLRRPRVALFSTGDELAMPGDTPPDAMKPGAIYNSNRFMLRGLLQAAGCEVTDLGIVPDQLEATRQALRQAAEGNDLIVTSGGVSVGEEDHLKPAVQAEGQLDLWQIAIKPGKPLAFGSVRRGDGSQALFLGLPGNPVSSFVTFLLAGRTVLRALQGMDTALPKALPLRAAFELKKADPRRREFLRVRLNEEGALELFPNQSSGVLTSAVWADGLVDLAAGHTVSVGDVLPFLPLAQLLA